MYMNSMYRKSFEPRYARSKVAVEVVRKFIMETMKIPVLEIPSFMCPVGEDPENYKDEGDLFMQMRAEVKHNPGKFWTGRSSCFESELIICNCYSYDRKRDKPKYWYIVNGPMTHCALVDVGATRDKWIKKPVLDPQRNQTYQAYHISKDDVCFLTMRDRPKGTLVA